LRNIRYTHKSYSEAGVAKQFRDEQNRQRIIESAWELVASAGVRSATMRAIGARAGVTTGSVTHYFDSKDAVMRAVLEYNNQRAAQRTESAARGLRGLAAARKHAMALLPTGNDGMSIWRVWLAFWMEAGPSPSGLSGLSGGWEQWRVALGRRLREAGEDGELPAGMDLRYESDRIGTLIAGIGLVYGVATQAGRPRLSPRARKILDDHFTALAATGEG